MAFNKRKLNGTELKLLYAVLPDEKPAYSKYRERIAGLTVIGYGRFGENNLILGNPEDEPDFTLPSSPVFSFGEMCYGDSCFEVTIHEEEEEKIEIEIRGAEAETLPESVIFDQINSIAFYSPRRVQPEYEPSRKIELIKGEFYLSFIISLRKIILTDLKTGYNALIPVSNFYNELMFVKNIRDPKTALNPRLLFEALGNYADQDLADAFVYYNKLFRRATINPPQKKNSPPVKEGLLKKIFKGNQE